MNNRKDNDEMKPKRKIYIAGPMRGLPHYNYPAFMRAEARLSAMGYEVVNPATMGDAYGTPEELAADPKLLKRLMTDELRECAACDAIYLLRVWEKSVGAMAELAVALRMGLEIIVQEVA